MARIFKVDVPAHVPLSPLTSGGYSQQLKAMLVALANGPFGMRKQHAQHPADPAKFAGFVAGLATGIVARIIHHPHHSRGFFFTFLSVLRSLLLPRRPELLELELLDDARSSSPSWRRILEC